jgi:hypothetical protein
MGPSTSGGSIYGVGCRFLPFRISNLEMVDQNTASWNRIDKWLRQVWDAPTSRSAQPCCRELASLRVWR